jgi:hypothetical protein
MRGFSLINISLAFGILLLVVGMTLPYGIASYQAHELYQDAANVTSFLESARNRAMAHAADYGIRREGHTLIQYEGMSFAGRDAAADQVLTLGSSVAMEAPTEIYFEGESGFPRSGAEEYFLSSGRQTYHVVLNAAGLVTAELAQ